MKKSIEELKEKYPNTNNFTSSQLKLEFDKICDYAIDIYLNEMKDKDTIIDSIVKESVTQIKE
jgi:hypothetical protein